MFNRLPKRMSDLKKMSAVELSQFLVKNPHIVESMSEKELLEIQEKVNPYAQTVSDENKGFAVFSHVNCRADYWKTFKAVSMVRFLKQLSSESQDWCKDAAGLTEEERE